MNVIGFKDLYFSDFNISNYEARNNEVKNNKFYPVLKENRTTSVFVYLKDCNIRYIFEDNSEFFAPNGSIVYIPHNVKYYVNYQSCSKTHALAQLVAFELHDANDEQFIASENIVIVCKERMYGDIFDNLVKISNSEYFSHTAFKALLYSMITEISKEYALDKIHTKDFYNIAPSVEYLKKNLLTNISVSELAKLSHISESCFRRQFKKQFDMTPSEYLTLQKINKAKKLLQNNMYSLYEISQISGYEDLSYFSKVFKKKTGISPGKYREKFQI